jgi:hypothetical protein
MNTILIRAFKEKKKWRGDFGMEEGKNRCDKIKIFMSNFIFFRVLI